MQDRGAATHPRAEIVRFEPESRSRETVEAIFDELRAALVGILPAGAAVEHIGSSAVPGALTKGDLDACVQVEASAFAAADAALAAAFGRNLGSDRTVSLSSFVDESRPVPVGIQLVARGGAEDFFVRWRDRLRGSPELLAEYNALKQGWHGREQEAYRAEKSRFIARGLAALPSPSPARAGRRTVHHADALPWLRARPRAAGASVVTSLPDVSELPSLDLDGWKGWFEDAAVAAMEHAADDGVAVFFQSDIRHRGLWVDKGALVARAAERAGMGMLFHKIVCRKPPGTITFGRASYSHLLGFARSLRPSLARATADVIPDAGFVPGRKAMGVNACLDACRFVLAETPTRTVVDPFCGWGTVLAVANALGLDAVGVDLSARMCRRARTLELEAAALAGPPATPR